MTITHNPNPHFEDRVPTPARAQPEHWAAGLTLLALMAWGGWQAAGALQSPAMQALRWTWPDFVQGKWGAAWNDALNQNLPAREALIGWANAGRYVLTRGAGDQVRLGRDGWLFSTEELQFHEHATQVQQAREAILIQTDQRLRARGVRLVVALVPDKARVHAADLAGGQYPAWAQPRYDDALARWRAAGVPVVDLRTALQAPPGQPPRYYRTDTHWNQLGAQAAAKAVADAVHALAPDLPKARFEAQTQPEAERAGDLLRMMGLHAMPNVLRPLPDREAPVQTRRVEAGDGGTVAGGLLDALAAPPAPSAAAGARATAGGLLDAPAPGGSAGGLLDTPTAPGAAANAGVAVALVGSSYSRRGNFDGYLQQALGAEVLNMAKDGGGFIQGMAAYLADDAFRTQPPRVLVWEIPERVLSAPLNDAERKGLNF